MDQSKTKKVLAHLSAKYGYPVWAIREMVEAQYDFLRKTVEEMGRDGVSYDSVRMHRFGIFYPNPAKVRHYKEMYAKNMEACGGEGGEDDGDGSFGFDGFGGDGPDNVEGVQVVWNPVVQGERDDAGEGSGGESPDGKASDGVREGGSGAIPTEE